MENVLFGMKNSMSKLVVAWDLDGTLIDSSHRATFKENGDFNLEAWIEDCTKENIFKDSLLPLSDLYFEFKKTGFTQICVTARQMTQHDFDYLKANGLEFDMILHRQNSNELDQVLKDKKLNEYFSQRGYLPFMAFDDKEDNLKIFDKYGFRTFQAIYMNEKLNSSSYEEISEIKPSFFS